MLLTWFNSKFSSKTLATFFKHSGYNHMHCDTDK